MAKVSEQTARAAQGRSNSPDARRRILDAAESEFASNGFDATPTARIAVTAGVPKGLLFYYFPKKIDILLTLLAERLPQHPLGRAADVARPGDVAGSLLRLARRVNLGEHRSDVLRTIIHREASTHPEVRDHISALRRHLQSLTEEVMDTASPHRLDPRRRRRAAQTYVAVMIADANARQLGAPTFDMAGTAEIVADGLLAVSA